MSLITSKSKLEIVDFIMSAIQNTNQVLSSITIIPFVSQFKVLPSTTLFDFPGKYFFGDIEVSSSPTAVAANNPTNIRFRLRPVKNGGGGLLDTYDFYMLPRDTETDVRYVQTFENMLINQQSFIKPDAGYIMVRMSGYVVNIK